MTLTPASTVFVDHVRFAFREGTDTVEDAVLDLMVHCWADGEAPLAYAEAELVRTDKAGNFSEARQWSWRGLPLFRVLAPGRSTRGVGHLIIDGTNCRLVHPHFFVELAAVGERRGWTPKRFDLAVDQPGAVLTCQGVIDEYDAGAFNRPGGGAPRTLDPREPRRGESVTGWTVYVGQRTSSNFVRVYDKRAEVESRLGAAAAAEWEGVVRTELELKAVKDGALLPWDVLRSPAEHFAADSAFLEALAGGVEPRRVGRVVRDQAEAELWGKLHHCRMSYGAVIEQAFWALGGDDTAAIVLLERLRRQYVKAPVPGVSEVAGGGVPDHEYVHEVVNPT